MQKNTLHFPVLLNNKKQTLQKFINYFYAVCLCRVTRISSGFRSVLFRQPLRLQDGGYGGDDVGGSKRKTGQI